MTTSPASGRLLTADCSDDGLTAPFCRPPCLTARIVSHLLVAECMPSCVHRATRFNTIATRCRGGLLVQARGLDCASGEPILRQNFGEIGRASCRERV